MISHSSCRPKPSPLLRDPRSPAKTPAVFIRFLRRCLLGLWLSALVSSAAEPTPASARATESDLTIVRVFSGWREAASFKRISEYLDGKENTGGELMVRTHPEKRGGYYFLIRVANRGVATAIKLQLQIIAPNSAKPTTYAFPVDLKAGSTVINVGLTGPDWPDKTANPVAWKITLLSTEDQPLASEVSYLWEKPGDH